MGDSGKAVFTGDRTCKAKLRTMMLFSSINIISDNVKTRGFALNFIQIMFLKVFNPITN